MTRRQFLRVGAGAAGAAWYAPRFAIGAPEQEQPHILFLMADQFRGDCLGCAGHPVIQTPNLDRLAGEGAWFPHAYSSTPTCTPARAALLTGLSPWNHGMLGYGKVAGKYAVEMPQALRDAGYFTSGIGKMHWTPQRSLHGFHQTILDESSRVQSEDFRSDYRAWFGAVAPNLDPDATGIGWNDYRSASYALPEELHPTRWMGDVATRFIETYDQPAPFFLKVSFARPHSPYDPPKRLFDRYAGAAIPEPAEGDWCAKYRERSDNSFNIWHGDMGKEQARLSRQGYYGSVSFVDEQIGRILAALERRGILEKTLILFTADHGDMTGDHHLWRKSYAYEPSARIPMIVRWPEGLVARKRGTAPSEVVEIRDVLPTFLDAAGARPATALDGASLLDLLRGDNPAWRPYIDLEHDICYDKSNHWNALTDGKTKYIYDAFSGGEQLFNLETDPQENHDLANVPEHAATLAQWRDRLIAHLAPRGDAWVREDHLVTRPQSILYSPNYPGGAPA